MNEKDLSEFQQGKESDEKPKEEEQKDCPKKVNVSGPSDCYFVKTGGGWFRGDE